MRSVKAAHEYVQEIIEDEGRVFLECSLSTFLLLKIENMWTNVLLVLVGPFDAVIGFSQVSNAGWSLILPFFAHCGCLGL